MTRLGVFRRPAAAAVVLVVAITTLVLPAGPARADDVRQLQWHLDYLRIDEAQRISTGQGVTVAVVDTGVYADHRDLQGQVLAGVDLSGSGTDGRRDDRGHGTGMAALIAAKGGGASHAYGIAPGARILPIRVSATETVQASAIAAGIRAAADRGAKVINVSIGSGTGGIRADERDAVAYALSKDAVVVSSAGNTDAGDVLVTWPAKAAGAIAVTGVDRTGEFTPKSIQGPEAVLAAPFPDIVTAVPPAASPTGYGVASGTSNSAAIVSGVAALVRAKYPQLDAANVVNRLIRTADDAGPPGRDPQYGFGRVNPVRALTENVAPVTANPLQPAASGSAQPSASTGNGAVPGDDFASGDGDDGLPAAAQIGIAVALAVGFVLIVALFVLLLRRRART